MKNEDIINQLTESLNCSKKEVINVVNILNMTEYWVENIMPNVCDDLNNKNDLKKQLKKSLNTFIRGL